MNICWNIYVSSSANLTLFGSVTRARIYLTNNISLRCTQKQPEVSLCRHYCSSVSGGEVMWSQGARVRRSTLPCRHASHWSDPRGHIRQTIYAPLADMLHEHLGPRGIPYRFQRGRFVTSDLNPTTASHSTPTKQQNNYGQKLEPF